MELSELIRKCRVDNVFLCEGPRQPQKGSLVLTGHHLIFSPVPPPTVNTPAVSSPSSTSNGGSSTHSHYQELWLLHRAVDRVLVEPCSRTPAINRGAYLKLRCKNFMACCIEMDEIDDCNAVARSIEALSNLSGIEHDYPFYYRCPFKILDDGWSAFDMEEQFAQLFIKCPDRWRISAVNKNYEVCLSYPELVIVPKGIGDDYLKISATFREGGRFPIFCYYHNDTKSCIVRCAQPLIGPTGRRCKEDETILNALLPGATKGVIFDTRTKAISVASKGRGGGSETQLYYCRWKYVYGNVPRIKDLHDSLAKLAELCAHEGSTPSSFYTSLYSSLSAAYNGAPPADRWIGRLASCGWLQHIADTVTGAAIVAQCVHCEEMSVVVHGAEGLDSTLLVTSIAQLCLDADARTIRGFQSLIEREWITAGHPFTLRCAHFAYASGTYTGPYESPVFLCFLDCVWQIMRQYPCSFEFNEDFLIFLFEHAYASEFGSFLGNSEMEKARFGVKSRTVSLWSYVNHPDVLPTFVSPLYEPYLSTLWPSVAPQSIVLWERMYLRWQRNWSDLDEVKRIIDALKRHEKELQSKLAHLEVGKANDIAIQSPRSNSTTMSLRRCVAADAGAAESVSTNHRNTPVSVSPLLDHFPSENLMTGGLEKGGAFCGNGNMLVNGEMSISHSSGRNTPTGKQHCGRSDLVLPVLPTMTLKKVNEVLVVDADDGGGDCGSSDADSGVIPPSDASSLNSRLALATAAASSRLSAMTKSFQRL